MENLLYCSKWQLSLSFVLFSECICACRKSVDIDGKLLPLKSLVKWSIMPWQNQLCWAKEAGLWQPESCKSWPMSLQGHRHIFKRSWWSRMTPGEWKKANMAIYKKGKKEDAGTACWSAWPQALGEFWKPAGRIRKWLGSVDVGLSRTNQADSFWWEVTDCMDEVGMGLLLASALSRLWIQFPIVYLVTPLTKQVA